MRGYLQRIAAGAVTGRSRVHPFVDSMYAGRREESGGPVVESVTKTVTAPQRSVDAPEGIETARVEVASEIEVRSAVERRAPEPVRQEESREFKPLLPERVAVVTSDRKAADVPQMRASVSQVDARVEDGSRAAEAQTVWSFRPLVERGDDAPRAAEVGTQTAFAATRREGPMPVPRGVARAAQARQSVATRPLETRSDDIQIHIGRIEVTAVHPPAPRPAPVAARKTMSLDEYLRGSGSGRA